MKVSESRKIHIIALPHDTWKARWSDDQSAISWRKPVGGMATAAGTASGAGMSFGTAMAGELMSCGSAEWSSGTTNDARHFRRDPAEARVERQPHQQQEVPVACTQRDAPGR